MRVAYWVRGDSYESLMQISAESVKRVYPKALIEVERDDGKRPAMVANLDAQLRVLARADQGESVLFLDVDTIVRKAFPFGHSDLYVTWRDHVGYSNGEKVSGVAELMPYNYGVVGVRASERTYEAFLWLRAQILKMAPQHQHWYGNQMALASLIGGTDRKSVRVRWSIADAGLTELSVCQLPCATWNYTPEKEGEDVSDRGIIHCKGNRKDLMQHYARAA